MQVLAYQEQPPARSQGATFTLMRYMFLLWAAFCLVAILVVNYRYGWRSWPLSFGAVGFLGGYVLIIMATIPPAAEGRARRIMLAIGCAVVAMSELLNWFVVYSRQLDEMLYAVPLLAKNTILPVFGVIWAASRVDAEEPIHVVDLAAEPDRSSLLPLLLMQIPAVIGFAVLVSALVAGGTYKGFYSYQQVYFFYNGIIAAAIGSTVSLIGSLMLANGHRRTIARRVAIAHGTYLVMGGIIVVAMLATIANSAPRSTYGP